ncbi:hypothetical protein SDC9_146111 [bioreactor metagenome]|uniref:Uncharacterized protein n=1 Tax=bioreactor metagenome TaxID=1076179 RepID=A0A645EC58_9ZZZZ
MAEVKVGFGSVVRHKNLTMLVGAHCPRINVDVRIKFLDCYLKAALLEQSAKGSRGDPLPKAGYNASCYKNILRFHTSRLRKNISQL